MTEQAAADWYPDPFARHEHRYWDGVGWTHHVATRGSQSTDPPVASQALAPATPESLKLVARELRKARVVAGASAGGGTLLSEPVLVVNRVPRFKALYIVYNQYGQYVGELREPRQAFLERATVWNKRRYLILDKDGTVVISLVPAFSLLRSRMIVLDAGGVEVGQLVERHGILEVGLGLVSSGEKVGAIYGEPWDFYPRDAHDNDIGRIAKFTRSVNYVIQIQPSLPEPLRTLVVAAALSMDIRAGELQERERAAKRASRGGGGDDGGWGWGDGGGGDGT